MRFNLFFRSIIALNLTDLNSSLSIYQNINDPSGISGCLNQLARIDHDIGNSENALQMLEESKVINIKLRLRVKDETNLVFYTEVKVA